MGVGAHHWPTSNDSLSLQLIDKQRQVRDAYAAYRAPPLGLRATGEELAAAASSWAEQMLRGGRNLQLPQDHIPPDTLHALRKHMKKATDFSNASLPPGVRRLPVFCNSPPFEPGTQWSADRLSPCLPRALSDPFCGVDLYNALALFPDSPRYVMLAALPLGDPLCFVIPQCRLHMTKMVLKFLAHWAWQGFAWTQTAKMHQYLSHWSCCGKTNETVFPGSPGLPIGLTAPLVLSLALAGHRIEHIRLSDDATHLQLRTDRTRVDYFSRTISPEPRVCERRRTSILSRSHARARC